MREYSQDPSAVRMREFGARRRAEGFRSAKIWMPEGMVRDVEEFQHRHGLTLANAVLVLCSEGLESQR